MPMASFATAVTFGGFNRRVASFRVAGVALCDFPTCFITCQKYSKIVLFSEDAFQFRGRRSTLATSIVISRGRRRTLDVSCCVFFANRIVRAASSGDKLQIAWRAWHLVRRVEN